MAQILNPQPTWQSALGSGLGQGIQAGVTGLLEQKLAQMAQERQFAQRQQGIDALIKGGYLGDKEKLTPDVLSGLKYVPESTLNTLLKGNITAPQKAAETQAAILQAQGVPVAEIVTRVPGLSGNFIKELNKATQGVEQEATRQEEFATKLINPEVTKLREKYHAAPQRKLAANTIINAVKSGNLRNPKTQALINKLHLQDFFQGNPTTQLFQSATNQLATNAGNAFNTKNLTNLDVGIYRNQLPKLTNTPEGNEVIAKNIILEEDANELRYKAYDELSKEGKITKDILDRAEQKIEPELKKLANKAMTNVLTVEFPPANSYSNGSIVRDPETGYKFTVVNGEYELIGDENGEAT